LPAPHTLYADLFVDSFTWGLYRGLGVCALVLGGLISFAWCAQALEMNKTLKNLRLEKNAIIDVTSLGKALPRRPQLCSTAGE